MSIITSGMGENQRLILQGYGFWYKLKKALEVISRVVIRVIPVRRKHFHISIPVYGNTEIPIHQELEIRGEKSFDQLWEIMFDDDPEILALLEAKKSKLHQSSSPDMKS